MTVLVDPRKNREKAFHDCYFRDADRGRGNGFYAICEASENCYEQILFSECEGKKVLEYGCGRGSYAADLARAGAAVTGIDISAVAIEHAQARTEQERLPNVRFLVMDAEALEFPDATFDRICGEGILHHLDLQKAYQEVARTLKPEGFAVFTEPLGHNPLINLYRKLTPNSRTPDEHPLLMKDLALAENYFQRVELRFFHLQSLAVAPLRKTRYFDHLVRWADAADQQLFRTVPAARRYAWQVILLLAAPR